MPEVIEIAPDAVNGEPDDVLSPTDKRAVRVAGLAFFCGILAVTVWPGGFTWLMNSLFDEETAERLFSLVTLILLLPIGLLAGGRTRRFGLYLALGMVISAVVVVSVAAATSWILFTFVN